MKFKASRSITLTAFGHVLIFGKGETLFVPPSLHTLAVEQGLDPVPEEGETPPEVAPKTDDSERVEKLKAAMHEIATRNNAADFDAGGVPKVRAIREASGGAEPVDAKERTALWAAVINSVGG